MMLEMVQIRIATGVTRVVRTAVVLRCGKQMENYHIIIFLDSLFPKTEISYTDRRGYSHLKEEALDRTMWRHRFGGGFGPVVRQNTE